MPDTATEVRVGQAWREIEKRESVCDVLAIDGDSVLLRERGSGYTGPINARHLPRLYTLEMPA